MEEADDGQCRVVYYCSGSDIDVSEHYRAASPPAIASDDSSPRHSSLKHVYSNVRRLLDIDQGGFHEVFIGSQSEQCLQRLESFANRGHAIVLVEFSGAASDDKSTNALPFLRSIAADVQSTRYRNHVMPFVLVATDSLTDSAAFSDTSFETTYFEAGALDTMRSPLCSEAVDRLVGHVKDATRPSAQNLGSTMARSLVDHITSNAKPQLASHRPDEILSAQRKHAVEDAIGKWHFPAHRFDMDELTYGALVMLEHILRNPALERYQLSRPELMTFLLAARRQYKHEREVHYHNWRHAVDVTQSLYVFLCDVRLCPSSSASLPSKKKTEPNAVERLLSPIDALILLVSAIGHDVGHPGVNNAFLVASDHQLAHMYNDKSVLENYHCAAYTQLLRKHWPSLRGITHFRSCMITTILATDMQRHFEYMGYLSDLKTKVEKSDPELADWSEKDRSQAKELVMALLLKAADISNVARPFDVSADWAKILMNEFSRQGELESELQIPTCLFGGPPDKTDLLAAAQSQKGFMNLFGFPLFRGISEIIPNVSCTLPELERNKEIWEKRIADEKSRRGAIGDDGKASTKTYGSVTNSQVEEARLRKRESEPAVIPTSVPQTPSSPIRRQSDIEANRQGTPSRHPASEQRQHLQLGFSLAEDKRSSIPSLWPNLNAMQLSPPGGSSRRSSKDVALTQLQELSAYAQQSLAPSGSRRGSADAGWQIHQNYPGSRRGSKDESLTTILVTSQGSPANRSSPASSQTKVNKPASPSKSGGVAKRHSLKQNQAQQGPSSGPTGHSIPSSRSQTTTSATVTTDQQSPSTQPSSLAPTDDIVDTAAPEPQHGTFLASATDDPSVATGSWPDTLDGSHHSSAPSAFPNTPPEPPMIRPTKSDSPRIIARMASGDSTVSRLDPRKHSEPQVRESRSRSRLRGLKFWKRRRDVSGPGAGEFSP